MRHAPGIPLPEHRFLPGTGAARPSFERPAATALSIEAGLWRDHVGLAFGFDLFERGFFWEAHEVWEEAWQLTAPGAARELLQGLIQLAAAEVQSRLGSPGGERLRDRGLDHLRAAAATRPIIGGVWVDDVAAGGPLRWRRRSRDLLGTPTDLAVQPLECVFERCDAGIVQRTPGYRDYYGGRALFADRPPATRDAAAARDAAREALAVDGAGFMNLTWEVEEPGPPDLELRDGDELDHFVVLLARALAIDPPAPAGVEIRAVGGDRDWARLADFAGRLAVIDWGEGGRDFTNWRFRHFRRTAELLGGGFVAAFDGDVVVGSLGLIDCGAMLRYQDVQVAPSHRRRGIARSLCARAFRDSRDQGGDRPAVIVAERGSIAHRLYEQLGFAHVSTQHALRWKHEG